MRSDRKPTRMVSFCAIWLVCMLAPLLTSCGGDSGKPNVPQTLPFEGELTIPDTWRGVWEMTFDLIDEETGKMHTQTVWADTLCAGDTLSVSLGPLMGSCDGYVRGDSLVFSAEESWEEGPCTITLILELSAYRENDIVTGAGEWRIETSGICGDGDSIAGRDLIELNGIRTSTVAGDNCQ